jgi:hypothetical protein
VTKLYVPQDYDFIPLLDAFKKWNHLAMHNKYKNNYEYNLAVHILNKKYFMSSEAILLVEETSPFSPIGQLHYQFYSDSASVKESLQSDDAIQCIVGAGSLAFGQAQCPGVTDYADGVDTMAFLLQL